MRYARLCSAHFEELCFEVDIFNRLMGQNPLKHRRRRTFKSDAVPTIFRFQHVPQPKASTQRKHSTKRTVKSEREVVSKQ